MLSYFNPLPFEKEKQLSEKDNFRNIIEKVFNNSVQALKDAQSIVDAKIIFKAAKWIFHANRIVIFGVGCTAIVSEDIEHKLFRIGIHSHTYSDNHLMVMVASQLKKR
ncbi:hypothetical protein [Gilliamella apicola]|uniref:hypothetical protein n=1 Tax=Gilliamella apicola TaxID=1196095 RepID=UPI00117BCE56|nr:hypothetical protein [Gilliamella apicola]